ncbi:unnamed protein product [Commelina yellow mottle virus]|uniref:Uncharacterized 23 kDa protein n=1 Tax=Commelina yellow mottle virus TaxID=10653 RepID=YOR1_COYMV|nr:hypothetical protein ComYMVgp1 [Commelina yellow mottle virus]P19200.1 RecName: Full=Uncharacterized 23 kDa protein; AltName: Full=ORF1 [Commelina yellow mottle virus]CAA37108.1 unnamed protein product [Commelina yellow mottle virus]
MNVWLLKSHTPLGLLPYYSLLDPFCFMNQVDQVKQKLIDWLSSAKKLSEEVIVFTPEVKINLRDLAHNIHIIAHRVALGFKVIYLYLVDIIFPLLKNIQKSQKESSENLQSVLKIVKEQRRSLKQIEDQLSKVQSELAKLREDYLSRRPLSKQDVEELVVRISEQPKFIEKQTEALTEELKLKVEEVAKLIHSFKGMVLN